MRKYTDITKPLFSVHNADIVRKRNHYPRQADGNHPAGFPSHSYAPPHSSPAFSNQWGYPFPTTQEMPSSGKGTSNLKIGILVVIIIFTTSLYVRSEATHNEDSVFYKMKEISLLFLREKGFINTLPTAPTIATLQDGSADAPPLGSELASQAANNTSATPSDGVLNTAEKLPLGEQNSAVVENPQSLPKTIPQTKRVPLNTLNTKLFLANVANDRNIVFQPFDHLVSQSDGVEYGDVLRELLNSDPPEGSFLRNFFTDKVKVRKAWLENETLIIDFNRSFEYSRYGYNGLANRIQQVLWTVFSLPPLLDSKRVIPQKEIEYVSFLIEGRRKDRIGGDGMTLNPFYSKEDLSETISATRSATR